MSALRHLTAILSPQGPTLSPRDLVDEPAKHELSSMEEEQMRAEVLRLRRALDVRNREVALLRSAVDDSQRRRSARARSPARGTPPRSATMVAAAGAVADRAPDSIWPLVLDATRVDGARAPAAVDVSALHEQIAALTSQLAQERAHARRMCCAQVVCPHCEEFVPLADEPA